jgi:hypothetical protein
VLIALRPHDVPSDAQIDRVWQALIPKDKDMREVQRLFSKYDTDSSGTIAADELEGILDELLYDGAQLTLSRSSGSSGGGGGDSAGADGGGGALKRRRSGGKRAHVELQAMAAEELARLDSTGSGELDLNGAGGAYLYIFCAIYI